MIWEMYFLLMGLVGFVSMLFMLMLGLILYVLTSYVLAKVGKKFGVGSFPEFLIPVYNVMLLCDCAKINRWFTAGVALPLITSFLHLPVHHRLISLLTFAVQLYLWGKIAERLGKNFWLWGFITALFSWVPAVVLAFDSSMPPGGAKTDRENQETIYIEI